MLLSVNYWQIGCKFLANCCQIVVELLKKFWHILDSFLEIFGKGVVEKVQVFPKVWVSLWVRELLSEIPIIELLWQLKMFISMSLRINNMLSWLRISSELNIEPNKISLSTQYFGYLLTLNIIVWPEQIALNSFNNLMSKPQPNFNPKLGLTWLLLLTPPHPAHPTHPEGMIQNNFGPKFLFPTFFWPNFFPKKFA